MTQHPKIELPKHVALIMSGTEQWAREQNLSVLKGHYRSAETLKETAVTLINTGIKFVSALVLSTDDWNRSKTELDYILRLVVRFLEANTKEFIEQGIKIVHVGARDGLPKNVLKAIDEAVRQTKDCAKGTLALGINYGGQQEIVDATKKLLRQGVDPMRMSPREFENALYVPELPKIDLVIRTGMEYRSSTFMMWQAAYAEYIFIDKYWPDFSRQDLKFALLYYSKHHKAA